ncbi:DUF4148 domain-containing protein [Paraburkholderia fungorum]|uniref:DUF4148 domain-containing protein n=1 Tax=Paraburkholderia fungorum TaxID=134537 RepID=UPI0038BBB902
MTNHHALFTAIVFSTLSASAIAEIEPHNPNTAASSAFVRAAQPQPVGKTREQVHEELLEARRQGLIPNTEADYPPSQRTIDANKTRHAIVERYWADNN